MQCPSGTFGNSTGLSSALCSGPCEAGHFCPPGSVSATQLRSVVIYLNTQDARVGSTIKKFGTDAYNTTCLVHMLPVWPTQFVEFAVLTEDAHDTTMWDLTKQTPGGMVNRMVWNEEELSFALTLRGTFRTLGSRWRPSSGPKRCACGRN